VACSFTSKWNSDLRRENEGGVLSVILADHADPHLPRYTTIMILHQPESDRDRCECAAVAMPRSRRSAAMERLLVAEVEFVNTVCVQCPVAVKCG